MMNNGLKYIYMLFIRSQGFYEIYEEKKNMLYIHFVNLKYLIHKTILSLLTGLLAHSLLLIIFRYSKPWRGVIVG